FRAASSAGNATASSLIIPTPAAAQPGDVELAAVDTRGAPSVIAPAGWTLVRSDANGTTITQRVYVHVVGASEPASYSWTWGSAQGASGGIVAYSGVDNANPVDVSGGQTGAGTAVAAPSVTTTAANELLVGFFGTAAAATFTAAPGM